MAAKTKKIYFPGQVAEATPFVDNIDEKLNIGGLGAKYGINAVDMAKSMDFKTNIPVKITQAESAMATAQALNNSKDEFIYEAKSFYNDMGHTMQKHINFSVTDMEALGFFRTETPPDPNTAQPIVSGITVLSDQVIIDWVRGRWQGVVIYSSYDGVSWTKLDKDFRSPYEDTRKNQGGGPTMPTPGPGPTPAASGPETRWYKLRYLQGDVEIGLELVVKTIADIH